MKIYVLQFSSAQSISHVQLWDPMDCSMPGFPVHHQLTELTQTHIHWVSDAIQPSHPLSSYPLLLSPSIFPSIKVFSSESVRWIRWPEYWSFSFTISHSNEHSGLMSFKTNWFNLLQSKGLLRVFNTTVQKHQFLWHSDFFMVQLSHPHITTRKTIALTIQIFVSQVMSLLFNMLSRFVVIFFQGASFF